MKKILVPVDFSKASITATDVAYDIAKRAGANVIILHVIEEVGEGSYSVEGEWASSRKNVEDTRFTIELIKKSRRQLEKLVNDPKYKDVRIDGELRMGNAYHGMRTIITDHKVDLVVMGTR